MMTMMEKWKRMKCWWIGQKYEFCLLSGMIMILPKRDIFRYHENWMILWKLRAWRWMIVLKVSFTLKTCEIFKRDRSFHQIETLFNIFKEQEVWRVTETVKRRTYENFGWWWNFCFFACFLLWLIILTSLIDSTVKVITPQRIIYVHPIAISILRNDRTRWSCWW